LVNPSQGSAFFVIMVSSGLALAIGTTAKIGAGHDFDADLQPGRNFHRLQCRSAPSEAMHAHRVPCVVVDYADGLDEAAGRYRNLI
jgi:hypothetical protein